MSARVVSVGRLAAVFALAGALGACKSPSPAARSAERPTAIAPSKPDLPELEPDPRERLLAQSIKTMLESEHLRHHAIDNAISKEAFDEYIKSLDPGKLFLLQEQVDELRTYADDLDDELRAGDLKLARVGAAMLAQRQKTIAKVIAEQLSKPFDMTRQETVQTDEEKLAFASTEAELADRWRRVLKLQTLERIGHMEDLAKAIAKTKAKGKSAAGESAAKEKKPAPGAPESDEEVTAAELAGVEKIPDTYAGREKKAREELAKSYQGRFRRLAQVEPLEPSESFLNAIAAVFDPHTRYMAPAEKDNFDIQMSGSLEGIGAVLSEDDRYILVREIVPGGASWKQGKLKAGDLILSVAQQGKEPVDVADMRINQVVQMIRGPKGTTVTLTVKKPDDTIQVIPITRDVVAIEAAYARGAIISNGNGKGKTIGYISLPSFYGNTRTEPGETPQRNSSDDLRALLRQMTARKVDGVIIDLRGNGGGLLDHARVIAGLFIPKGPVVQTKFPNEDSHTLADDDPAVEYGGHVVVLVDRFSASASEIVAAALQDYKRAIIVGTGPTHGKGTVQMLLDLDRLRPKEGQPLGVLKLTIQQFYRITGESTQWRGVIPDIVLPDPVDHLDSRERDLDHAIPWSKTDGVPFAPWDHQDWNLAALVEKSRDRTSRNEAFAKVKERSDYLEKRRKDTLVPLQREQWEARRAADKKELEQADPKLEEGPRRLRVTVVDYSRDKSRAENERLKQWKKDVATDPWIEESRNILLDMLTPPTVTKAR